MSIITNQVSVNETQYFFLEVNSKVINTSTLNANYISTNKLYADEAVFSSIKGNIVFESLKISSLTANYISTNILEANQGIFSSIKGNIEFNSTITFSDLIVSSIQANNISTNNITANNAYISSLNANNILFSSLQGDRAFISTLTATDIFVSSIVGLTGTFSSFNTNNLNANYISAGTGYYSTLTTDTLYANYISSGTGTFSTLTTNNIFTNFISAGTGFFSTLNTDELIISSNIVVPDIFCSNITISNTATIGGQTTLNGATTANQDITMNADINFSVQNLNVTDPLFVNPHDVLLYNINNLNGLNCGSITCIGGAQSNTDIFGDFIPPFHNASFVTIGGGDRVLDGGVACQAIVTINGQQPDIANPGTNLTTALTVLGDVEIGAVDPLDWGTLTSYNGTRLEGINPEGLALEVAGDAVIVAPVLVSITAPDLNVIGDVDITGLVGIGGALGVAGALGVVGITTATGAINANGGIGVLGAFGQTAGDWSFGDVGTGFSGTIYNPLTIRNNLNMSNNNIDNVNIINASNINIENANISTLRLFNLSTNSIVLYPDDVFPPAIAFTDLSANLTSVITDVNTTLFINATSSIQISASNILGLGAEGNVGIGSTYSNIGIGAASTLSLTAGSNITIFAPETIVLQSTEAGVAISGSNAVAIGTQYDTNLFLTLDNITGVASTNTTFTAGSNFIVNANANLQGGNIFLNSDTIINSISTNSISTGSLFTRFLSTSQINTSSIRANNISSIFNQVSSMRVQTTIQASTIQVNRLQALTDSGTITGNLYPVSGSAFIGYGSNTAQGGFYAQGTFRSTFTQVIHPSLDSGIYSNIVRIQGNTLAQRINASTIFTSSISTHQVTTAFLLGAGAVAGPQIYTNTLLPNGSSAIGNTGNNFFTQGCLASTFTSVIQPRTDAGVSVANSNVVRINGFVSTQNIFVSTINRKQYPFTSTLGVFGAGRIQSTFTISGTSATTPQVLLSNITFPIVGNYLVSQKNTITKSSGGNGAEPYGSLCLSRGLFPSTFATEDGFNAIPFINHTNVSTFNTYTTSITITNPLSNTRNLTYYDQSGHNYNLDMAVGDFRIKYIPFQGLNPE